MTYSLYVVTLLYEILDFAAYSNDTASSKEQYMQRR